MYIYIIFYECIYIYIMHVFIFKSGNGCMPVYILKLHESIHMYMYSMNASICIYV